MQPYGQSPSHSFRIARFQVWYVLVVIFFVVVMARLFYLQVIRHDFYRKAALSGQRKEYEVPATRGTIEAHDGDDIIPIVLNEKRYTLFADPVYLRDPAQAAVAVAQAIGGDAVEYEKKMRLDTRYAVLAKKLDKAQKEKIDNLKIKGVGTREQEYRTYPQNELAAQVLGFVDDEGAGKYGIEQYLDEQLRGSAGELKAVTDAQGVPLAASGDNIVKSPVPGKKIVLTIDVSMQRQLEDILKEGLEKADSKSGSALIMDPNTGAIKAMANLPTYNPAEFAKTEDINVFNNAAVSAPLEVGSIMKPLLTSAVMNEGIVNPDTTYYDPGFFVVDDARITNVEGSGGPGQRTVEDILKRSLNTGATWLLMQLGGGEINEKARVTWHNYMVNHYQLGKLTGIEQGYEAPGVIPDPKDGYGLNIRYANTAFGQGMSATPLQMGAALSSVINGGNYYRPYLVDKTVDPQGQESVTQPAIVKEQVVSQATSKNIKSMLEAVVQRNHRVFGWNKVPVGYSVGGKTGTAEIANPEGGYYDDRFNGTYMGFIGGNRPEYVIVVRVNEPKIEGYAGSKAAAPIFLSLCDMLISNIGVAPITQ